MRILMVDPDNFDVTYSINPWMNTDVSVNIDLVKAQWKEVKRTLEKDNIDIEVMKSVEGLPDMVFAANAGMIKNNKAIVSNFRDPERQGEEFYFEKWFRSNGFETHTLPSGLIWEGEACSVFIGEELLCSHSEGGRANKEAYTHICDIWNIENENVKYVELIDPYFYHLDVSLCLLNDSTAILCPLAFKAKDYMWIKSRIPNIVEVSYDDALNFNCNAFVHDNKIYFNDGISTNLKNDLLSVGFEAVEIDVSEFVKAGGAVKCLILTVSK